MSVSDMMTGLMMVFLFVSLVFMQQIRAEKQAIQEIAITYQDLRAELHLALYEEFKDDLSRWNAEILEDSTIRFNEPSVLFAKGSKDIRVRFMRILDEFFPRYIGLLGNEKYRAAIGEIRIEGHTSTTWEGSRDLRQRYLNNAHLSQERSFSILKYCFGMSVIQPDREWLTKVLRANGLAFAKPIYRNGIEDTARSRRVEFKVTTQAEERIFEIIDAIKSDTLR